MLPQLSLDLSACAGAAHVDGASFAMGSWAWVAGGRRHVTVALKTTVRLVVAGRGIAAPPEPFEPGSSEVAPVLPFAQISLIGHAYAPGGREAHLARARLAVLRGQAPIFDKSIEVRGDRRRRGAADVPFTVMPLVHERAPASEWNPVGRKRARGDVPPNLTPLSPSQPIACFAPIPDDWSSRTCHLGPDGGRGLAAEVPEVDGVDLRYFLDAPFDQWVPHLVGDETLVLEGLSPHADILRTDLPPMTARASWRDGRGGAGFDLRLDCISIDADRGMASLIRRGHFTPSEGAARAPDLSVVIAITPTPAEAPFTAAHEELMSTTVASSEAAPRQPTMPFQAAVPGALPPTIPRPPTDDLDRLVGHTLVDEVAAPTSAVLTAADVTREALVSGELEGANLEGVDSTGRDLRQARLRGAKLDRARLRGELRLAGADLEGASLREADLDGASLEQARLDGASMVGASIERATLQGATLHRADLERARMGAANLDGVLGDQARFDGADLARSQGQSCRMTGASFVEVTLDGARWSAAELPRGRFDRASLRGADLDGANLTGASWTRVDAREASLRGANLTDAVCEGARFDRADLTGAVMTGAMVGQKELALVIAARPSRAGRSRGGR